MGQDSAIVYVVDDDAGVRAATRSLLASIGLEVRTFECASEFLGSKRPEVPSCLVLDVRLPGLSGLDLQRKLGQSGASIPIVFITVDDEALVRRKSLCEVVGKDADQLRAEGGMRTHGAGHNAK